MGAYLANVPRKNEKFNLKTLGNNESYHHIRYDIIWFTNYSSLSPQVICGDSLFLFICFFSLFLSEFLKTVIKKMNECLWVRMSPLTTDMPKVHTKSLSKFLQIMDHVSNLHY